MSAHELSNPSHQRQNSEHPSTIHGAMLIKYQRKPIGKTFIRSSNNLKIPKALPITTNTNMPKPAVIKACFNTIWGLFRTVANTVGTANLPFSIGAAAII